MAVIAAALIAVGACRGAPHGPRPPVRIVVSSLPGEVDPHHDNEFLAFSLLANVYEALTSLDAQLRAAPALAESWTTLDDYRWRFRLRAGVRFHDGRPLTARDAAWSLERARRPAAGGYASYIAAIQGVTVVDDLTLEIRTSVPTAILPHKLAFILVVPYEAPHPIREAVGTGPYRLRRTPGETAWRLSAFDRYWKEPPPVREIELLGIADGRERGRRVAEGEADLAPYIDAQDAAALWGRAGVRVVARPGMAVTMLRLRMDVRPFSDPRVRRAVYLAFDRRALVDTLAGGFGRPASQLVGHGVFGFDPALSAPDRDLGEARRLLASAGYPRGFEVALDHRVGRRADAVVSQLAEAGIRCRPQPQLWPDLARRLHAGDFKLFYGGLISDSGDASDILDSVLHSSDPRRGFGDANYSAYSSPQLDALAEAAWVESRLTPRRALLQRAMAVAMRDLPVVPLVVPDDLYAIRGDLQWEPRLDARLLAADLSRRR